MEPRFYIPGAQNGPLTFEDFDQFAKASAITSTYETNPLLMTGMTALRPVNLEPVVRKVVDTQDKFRIYKVVPKERTQSAVNEYTVQVSIGGQVGGTFGRELAPLRSQVGSYRRRVTYIKQQYTMASIGHFSSVQRTLQNMRALENVNAVTRLLRDANWSIFFGDESVAPLQFNGIETILKQERPTHVIDMSQVTTSTDPRTYMEAWMDTARSIGARIGNQGNFGELTHVFSDPLMEAFIQKYLDPTYRIMLDNNPTTIAYGSAVPRMRIGNEVVENLYDIYIPNADSAMPQQAYDADEGGNVRVDANSPGAPTLAVASPASPNSRFDASKAGTYVFRVAAISESGEEGFLSAPVSHAVAAGDIVEFTITPNPDLRQTGYAIYVTTRNPSGTPGLKDYRLIKRVPATNPGTGTQTVVTWNLEDIPGSSRSFFLNINPQSISYLTLFPTQSIPLYATGATGLGQFWAVAMYTALQVSIPQHHFVVKNILPPEMKASWKPW